MAGTLEIGKRVQEDVFMVGKITESTRSSELPRVSERNEEMNLSVKFPQSLEHARTWMDSVSNRIEEFPPLVETNSHKSVPTSFLAKVNEQMTAGADALQKNNFIVGGKGNLVCTNKSFEDNARTHAPHFQDIFVTLIQALQPTNKGKFYEISIPENLYQEQLQKFSFSLIARLLLNKGAAPIPIHELKKVIQTKIGLQDSWNLVSLGKSFFTLQLTSARDQNLVHSNRYWVLSGGVLKVRDWVLDFHPFKVQTTVAPVWVWIYILPFEY